MNRCTHTPVSVLCFGKPYNVSGVWGRVPVSTSWTNGSQWTKCFYAKMHRKASESYAEIQFVTRVHAWRVGLSGILLLLTRLYSIRCGRLHYHTDFFLASDVYLTPITTIIYFQARRNRLGLFCYMQHTLLRYLSWRGISCNHK